jgi:hypothetical protein
VVDTGSAGGGVMRRKKPAEKVRARFRQMCPKCRDEIAPGAEIKRNVTTNEWVHESCKAPLSRPEGAEFCEFCWLAFHTSRGAKVTVGLLGRMVTDPKIKHGVLCPEHLQAAKEGRLASTWWPVVSTG